MLERLRNSGITQKKVIMELDKLKMLDLYANIKTRLINPPTQSISSIITALELQSELVCDDF